MPQSSCLPKIGWDFSFTTHLSGCGLLLHWTWLQQALHPLTNCSHQLTSPPTEVSPVSTTLQQHALAAVDTWTIIYTLSLQQIPKLPACRNQSGLPDWLPKCLLPVPLQTKRHPAQGTQLHLPGVPLQPGLCHCPGTLPLQHHSTPGACPISPSLASLGLHACHPDHFHPIPQLYQQQMINSIGSPFHQSASYLQGHPPSPRHHPTNWNWNSRTTNGHRVRNSCWTPATLMLTPSKELLLDASYSIVDTAIAAIGAAKLSYPTLNEVWQHLALQWYSCKWPWIYALLSLLVIWSASAFYYPYTINT
jgi:hypothetical protein